MEMSTQDIALGMGIAIAIGGLVGVERERKAQQEKRPSFGGIRTFPLIGMFGALGGLMSQSFGTLGLAVPFVGLLALLLGAYLRQPRDEQQPRLGLTSEISALLVFCLGAVPFTHTIPLEFSERVVLAAALGTLVMAALALREPLHGLAQKVSSEDLLATVRFALLAAVLLPLLPDQTWDMFDSLNPRKIGMVVVLIAAVSFVGYVAVRIMGERRGIGVTAVFGGIASSTAVTLTFSGRAKQQPELARVSAFAIVIACTIMLPRLGVMIAAMHAPLMETAWPLFASTVAVGVAGSAVLYRIAGKRGETVIIKREGTEAPQRLNNPFSLKQAIKLGIAFAVIRFVAAAAYHYFHEAGFYVSALLAGLTEVDAITISATRMYAQEKISAQVANTAIACAILTNSLIKSGFALFIGGRRVGILVASVLIPTAIVGIITALLT